MNKKKEIGLLLVVVLIIAAAVVTFVFLPKYDKKEESPQGEEDNRVPIQELKGLKIIDPDSNSRPIAVMINNHAAARPYHSGLQDAYIVYEMIVEGGISRMMAIYKDADTARIGSVRSSRHYYLDYVMENDAIYVHYGASPQASGDMSKYGINHIDSDKNVFIRDTSLPVAWEHNAFANMSAINTTAASKKFRTTSDKRTLLNYKVDEVDLSKLEGAIPANKVSIKYSSYVTSGYTYDSTNKVYLRTVNGNAHKDAVTNKQYTAKNIITYQVANSTIEGGGKGRQELDNLGNGTGYYISNGYAVPINWSKPTRESQTKYTYLNGEEIEVNDGNTFIQIQPKGQSLVIE